MDARPGPTSHERGAPVGGSSASGCDADGRSDPRAPGVVTRARPIGTPTARVRSCGPSATSGWNAEIQRLTGIPLSAEVWVRELESGPGL